METIAIFIGIISVILPIITLIYIIIAAISHEKKQKISHFELSIRAVCLYFVIIISLGGFVVGSIMCVNEGLNYFYPEVSDRGCYTYKPKYIGSETEYSDEYKEDAIYDKCENDSEYKALQTEYEQKSSLVDCSMAATFALVSLIVFMRYNIKASELRKENIEKENEENKKIKKEKKIVEKSKKQK